MRYALLISCLFVTIVTFAACSDTEQTPEAEQPGVAWTYEGITGPALWGTLSDEYAACSEGREQSPIALERESASESDQEILQTVSIPRPLTFNYGRASLVVEDTGTRYQATPNEEHTLRESYRLLQFHVHTPSEHTIDGQSYPMEVHFVHQNDKDRLAIVGVMVEAGAKNAAYHPFVEASANAAQDSSIIESLEALLPSDHSYFTYRGSLTTPPCTEGVRWFVLSEPVTLSETQIAVFSTAQGSTNRPIQPLLGSSGESTEFRPPRTITEFRVRRPDPTAVNPEVVRAVPLTEEARKAGITGYVIVQYGVTPEGKPDNIRIVRGLGYGLDERALQAVQQLRFEPAPAYAYESYSIPVRFKQE